MVVIIENYYILFLFTVVKNSLKKSFFNHRLIVMKYLTFFLVTLLFWHFEGYRVFFKRLHLYIYVFQLVVHGLNPWETLYPAVFFLRKKGPHMKAVLETHADSCMWAAFAAWVTWMSVYKVEVDLLVVHLALLLQLLALQQGWAS